MKKTLSRRFHIRDYHTLYHFRILKVRRTTSQGNHPVHALTARRIGISLCSWLNDHRRLCANRHSAVSICDVGSTEQTLRWPSKYSLLRYLVKKNVRVLLLQRRAVYDPRYRSRPILAVWPAPLSAMFFPLMLKFVGQPQGPHIVLRCYWDTRVLAPRSGDRTHVHV